MKVVIRGERGVGKSVLLARLQGKPFFAEYTETPVIDVGTVLWNYKSTYTWCMGPRVRVGPRRGPTRSLSHCCER